MGRSEPYGGGPSASQSQCQAATGRGSSRRSQISETVGQDGTACQRSSSGRDGDLIDLEAAAARADGHRAAVDVADTGVSDAVAAHHEFRALLAAVGCRLGV